MRRIWTLLSALPLLLASCTETPGVGPKPAEETIEVAIGSGPKIGIETQTQTRTELDEDGETVRWADNDRIVLWAVDSQDQMALERQLFKLWHYDAAYNTAKFTATVPEMAADTYTYYAVSPEPFETSRLEARYRIPAEQNGTFDGACDIQVAAPVTGPALQRGDNSETVNFRFEHKVHVLKIRIPSNDLGEEITKITLTFPEPVTGILTVNAADPAAAPQLTGGGNTLTLVFDTPKKVGDTVFAIIAPVELTADQPVTVTATGVSSRQSRPKEFAGKHFAAGHTTPIAFHIPAAGPTYLRVTLADTGEETLGERISNFTLTAAEGVDLGGGTNVRTFPVAAAGNFDLAFEEFPATLAGQTLAVSYESENALLSGDTFVIPASQDLIAGAVNSVATLSVPYLMEEDFSAVISQDWGSEWTGSDPNNTAPSSLDACGLSGWTGSRVGVEAGSSLRISCNTITVFGRVQSRRQGRIDTNPLTSIKPDKTPTIKVTYTYCGTLFEGVGSGGNILVSAGYTRQTGGIDSKNEISDIIVPEAAIDKDATDNNAYYNKAGQHEGSFTITSADPSVRLSWRVSTDRGGTGNGCYWLYLDNIKVSIVPTPSE